MATTKITSPDLFDLGSLNTALQLPSGTTAERPTSPSTGEWRYNTTTNLVEFWDGGEWRDLQSENIPPINSENFNTVLYTGNGSTQSITGVGFKPDWIWIKERTSTSNNVTFDSTRGIFEQLYITTDAQSNNTSTVSSFDSDGFSVGVGLAVNENGQDYVAWCWKAKGGTTSSNTDGTVTSTVQANTAAGFSIIKYVGNGVINQSIGHGLNSTPELYITKNLDTGGTGWFTKTTVIDGSLDELALNTTDAASNITNTNLPTSSVIYQYNNTNLGANGQNYIVYAFHSVAGYSKFGSYTGNGSDNGPIVNTGFEPAFVIFKRTDSADNWLLFDNKRNPSNPRNLALIPNSSAAESVGNLGNGFNFLSNGFQVVSSDTGVNANGGTYIYIAFASDPSAAPALADSFDTALYTGNGGTQSITGLGFSPSFVWIKKRNGTEDHAWFDIVRGVQRQISSNLTAAGYTTTNAISSFDADGWTTGNNGATNASGETYVAWNWKANPIPTINTDGTIQSVVSANQAAGFSVVKYVGNGSSGSTIGHGLSSAPEVIIAKNLQNITAWGVYVKDNVGSSGNPASERLTLQTSDATTTTTAYWGGTEPTSSVFTVGTENAVNQSGYNTIAYCFTSIAGFSKFGSYTGNGSSTGPVVTTGFQLYWLMIKRTDSSGDWLMYDSERSPSNPRDDVFRANTNAAELTTPVVNLDFLSTGFQLKTNTADLNANGGTYIYMAFKENPTPYPLAGNMSFLVVAGGGGGGYWMGGGAGAGGLRTSYGGSSGGGSSSESDITLASGTYTITVGAAGTGMPSGGTTLPSAGNGGDSSIAASGLTTITSIGGGGGGAYAILQPSNAVASGANGGSGGGAWSISNQGQSAGTGTANQGYAGALGGNQTSAYGEGTGGGGGAAGAGTQGINGARPNGGAGLSVSITGSAVDYAGGGGGATTCASPNNATNGGLGGTGGGGNGGYCSAGNDDGGNGTTNTGGGGGGSAAVGTPASSGGTAGNGGSGVVVLRLLTSEYSSSTTGSPTVTTDGDYTVLTYTGSGTYVHS